MIWPREWWIIIIIKFTISYGTSNTYNLYYNKNFTVEIIKIKLLAELYYAYKCSTSAQLLTYKFSRNVLINIAKKIHFMNL